jgi:hypothetical protein
MSKEKERQNMSNDVTTTGPNPYEAFGESATRGTGVFLKFAKGDYVGGPNADEIPIGTLMIADMTELSVGWVRWEDGSPSDRVMGKLSDGFRPPRRTELGDNDQNLWDRRDGEPRDPWQRGTEVPMIMRDDPEQVFTFVTGSKGGEGAIGELCKIYGKHIRIKPKEIPVIRLDVGSYQHSNKAFGRIKYPVFEVIGWVDRGEYDGSGGAPGNSPSNPGMASVIEDQRAEQAAKARRRTAAPVRNDADDDDYEVPFR